jgi:hypothetical protein
MDLYALPCVLATPKNVTYFYGKCFSTAGGCVASRPPPSTSDACPQAHHTALDAFFSQLRELREPSRHFHHKTRAGARGPSSTATYRNSVTCYYASLSSPMSVPVCSRLGDNKIARWGSRGARAREKCEGASAEAERNVGREKCRRRSINEEEQRQRCASKGKASVVRGVA